MSNQSTFEKALESFDNSLNQLEKENTNIDQAIELYEKAIGEYNKCIEFLDSATQKIEIFKEGKE
ncbi:MAG: exodeoxyribonuclease VII small subunit [Bacilli bacterium]